jgi:hypothetical protein
MHVQSMLAQPCCMCLLSAQKFQHGLVWSPGNLWHFETIAKPLDAFEDYVDLLTYNTNTNSLHAQGLYTSFVTHNKPIGNEMNIIWSLLFSFSLVASANSYQAPEPPPKVCKAVDEVVRVLQQHKATAFCSTFLGLTPRSKTRTITSNYKV